MERLMCGDSEVREDQQGDAERKLRHIAFTLATYTTSFSSSVEESGRFPLICSVWNSDSIACTYYVLRACVWFSPCSTVRTTDPPPPPTAPPTCTDVCDKAFPQEQKRTFTTFLCAPLSFCSGSSSGLVLVVRAQ